MKMVGSLAIVKYCTQDSLLLLSAVVVPSAPPTVDSYYAVDATTLYLSWTAPPLDQQNGIIRHYNILLTELETGSAFIYTSTNINHTITSLHPHYHYQIEVSAITIGTGPASAPLVLQMPEDGKNNNSIVLHSLILYLHDSS